MTLAAAVVLHGDVTLHYRMSVKLNPTLPAAMTQRAMEQMSTAMPIDSTMQFKGGKGFSSSMGITSITDFSTQQVTLIDGEKKRYATIPWD